MERENKPTPTRVARRQVKVQTQADIEDQLEECGLGPVGRSGDEWPDESDLYNENYVTLPDGTCVPKTDKS